MWRSSYIYCALWIVYLQRNSSSFFKPSFRFQVKAPWFSKRYNIVHGAPPGPENFRYGWQDGCDTGKAATGKSKHKLAYAFFKDVNFIEGDRFNEEYQKVLVSAFLSCQRYFDVLEAPEGRSLL